MNPKKEINKNFLRVSPVFVDLLKRLIEIKFPEKSTREVAELFQIAPSSLSRTLAGKIRPTREHIRKMATVLDADPDALLAAVDGIKVFEKAEDVLFPVDFFDYTNIYSPACRFAIHSWCRYSDDPAWRRTFNFFSLIFSFQRIYCPEDLDFELSSSGIAEQLSEVLFTMSKEIHFEVRDLFDNEIEKLLTEDERKKFSLAYAKRFSYFISILLENSSEAPNNLQVAGDFLRIVLHASLFLINSQKYLSAFSEKVFAPIIHFNEFVQVEINLDLEIKRVEKKLRSFIAAKLQEFEDYAENYAGEA
ncbi:MAG: helix-turn-helix transcriptional regulator [Thermoanaerobacter sp.]|nr:helix-turn-helix transcriptional regulator [Thermoanaerobacter sp.]